MSYTEHLFDRYGVLAVFVARFIALLRMSGGPMAGSLGMHYPKFLAANATGAVIWASGTVLLVHVLGSAAHQWLSRGAWALLVVAVVLGVALSRVVGRAFSRGMERYTTASEC